VELAVGDTPIAEGTAGYYYHLASGEVHSAARDTGLQDRLIDYCAAVSGINLPS
jgi:hypothetical protein